MEHPVKMAHKNSKRGTRGTIISNIEQIDLQYWSELEQHVAGVLLADPTIRELRCQFPTIEWVDDDGEVHEHRFDYFAVYHDGTQRAFNVKYVKDKAAVDAVFDALKDVDLGFEMIWVNETMATLGCFQNAMSILTARENYNAEDYLDALMSLEGIHGAVYFHSLLKGARNLADRREALLNLIDRGVIVIANELERLADYSKVHISRPLLAQELKSYVQSVA
ncbi:hypothetical protein NKZ03_26960 [Sinorhizobium meliloti]|uniref:hypothetical protein n=1 Tax=Rhizobium meliloti TaxID=382 RepID=UPI000FD36B9E|nr:hypothetical protein [Sinorhizobium meliloti]MDW9962154.1 hypothetical protein [Sinorhizobium meliloti]MQX41881.1 hypothetical protein [Sinorhizobium meliloti]MQX71542.1 hypothetical protein [Sinorhizobium meliloti]MQX93833.1 hypothetical protein [Sinorhizobium meliloti]RVG68119.1 hypothetical protein CN220_20150 [Sinorhizobium meliloti]